MLSPVKLWRRQRKIRGELNQQGRVFSWTKIFVAPRHFKTQTPYYLVLVKLRNGEKLIGQLVDEDRRNITIGMEVISVLRRLRRGGKEGVVIYGLKFKPL